MAGSTTAMTRTPARRATTPHDVGRRARRDAVVRVASVLVVWAGLLLVTYWWVAGGGVQDLSSWETGLLSLGRITGLVAADLLLVQVLLMARLPFLEGAWGQDELARLHLLVGFTSFNLMVAHVGLITWGYAAGELTRTPATLWDLTWNYPGMLLAVVGTACLVMVVVTSVRAARRRLRYESWHLLHLYAYLGVGLALPHQLWTGQEFLASTAATVYWWTLWGAAAAAVVTFRVVLPVARTLRHGVRVTSVVEEAPGIVSVHMTGRALDRSPVEAGQFYTWRFLDRSGWTRGNPYSLSAAPTSTDLRITVREVGDGSASLRRLRPGTRVMVEGPYGRLSARSRYGRGLAFIGAGVGIAPLHALAESMPYAPGEAVLLQRFHDSPLFQPEFSALVRGRGLRVLNLPGPRRSADSWLGAGIGPADDVTALRYWIPDVTRRDVYVCGPQAWTESVLRSLDAVGVPRDHVHVENFGW